MWTFADEEETANPEQDALWDSPGTQAPAEGISQMPSLNTH